eukprot:Pompholyxophrys_punicea_v1_NODE_2_length_10808_cov_35.677950.p4 type:complete len:187 gc:universal NODE_2_length_10808_cov_35.677950:1563-2123(+)
MGLSVNKHNCVITKGRVIPRIPESATLGIRHPRLRNRTSQSRERQREIFKRQGEVLPVIRSVSRGFPSTCHTKGLESIVRRPSLCVAKSKVGHPSSPNEDCGESVDTALQSALGKSRLPARCRESPSRSTPSFDLSLKAEVGQEAAIILFKSGVAYRTQRLATLCEDSFSFPITCWPHYENQLALE